MALPFGGNLGLLSFFSGGGAFGLGGFFSSPFLGRPLLRPKMKEAKIGTIKKDRCKAEIGQWQWQIQAGLVFCI